MAFTNFYLIAGGTGSADINAGSSIGAAQAAATTNGSWNSGTGVFIATGGTPFASTTTNDYASVYVDGATVTTFVGKVTTVTSSTQITVDVATIKYGTAPSTSATGRSCVINGSWNSEIVLAAGGLATFTVPQSTKINIKGNLTTAASRTISMAGTTTAPLWFSGYNTTPGDLDNDTTNTLAKPIWTLGATFFLNNSGTNQTWSALSVVGNRSGNIWSTGTTGKYVRVRSENTSANAAATAFSTNGTTVVEASWFKCPTTATTTGVVSVPSNNVLFRGCVFEGGGIAGVNVGAQTPVTLVQCILLNNTGAGVLVVGGTVQLLGCSFISCTVDGVKWTSSVSTNQAQAVIGCLFAGPNGGTAMTNGINNNTGTNTNSIYRASNDYYNVTNAEVGMGDSPAFFGQTDGSFPLISSTNLTPVTGSNARANGFPGIFENEIFSSYSDIGAVRHADPAGFAGAIFGG